MSELIRDISAVFRFFPDERGDIRIIHNGHSKLEIDEAIEELWFGIDNRRTLFDVYQSFCDYMNTSHDTKVATLFADILEEFYQAGFIKGRGDETTCLACGSFHLRSETERISKARFSSCPTCFDSLGILSWGKMTELECGEVEKC